MTNNRYDTMLYSDGTTCASSGSKRRVTVSSSHLALAHNRIGDSHGSSVSIFFQVHLKCGTGYGISEVTEPSVCNYDLRFTLPEACNDNLLAPPGEGASEEASTGTATSTSSSDEEGASASASAKPSASASTTQSGSAHASSRTLHPATSVVPKGTAFCSCFFLSSLWYLSHRFVIDAPRGSTGSQSHPQTGTHEALPSWGNAPDNEAEVVTSWIKHLSQSYLAAKHELSQAATKQNRMQSCITTLASLLADQSALASTDLQVCEEFLS